MKLDHEKRVVNLTDLFFCVEEKQLLSKGSSMRRLRNDYCSEINERLASKAIMRFSDSSWTVIGRAYVTDTSQGQNYF